MRATTANLDNGGAALGTVGMCHRARTDAGCAYPPRFMRGNGYTMGMETQTTTSRLDLICETLGVSPQTLAERARVAPEDIDMTRDEHWYPTTLVRLSEHLGVSPDFFNIPTEQLTELLKAFSVVEPSHRLTLIDKIWTTETVWRAMEGHCGLSWPGSIRLTDLLQEFSDRPGRGIGSFVAFVRRELEMSHVMLFSHPFGNRDHTAILFVPGEHFSPFKYLVVNESEWLSSWTNALLQWYEVLRLLSRLDETDINSEASWTTTYLEPTVDGYCPRLNEQLHRRFILHDFTVLYLGDSTSATLDLKQYWWDTIFYALMQGVPPAVIAEYGFRQIESDGEETDDGDEIEKQIVRSLNQPFLIDEIVKQVVGKHIVPTNYDWVIPSYPSFIQRLAMNAFAQRRISRHILLRVLSISEDEYDGLLKKVERLDIGDPLHFLLSTRQ
jgi:hypothetical protein